MSISSTSHRCTLFRANPNLSIGVPLDFYVLTSQKNDSFQSSFLGNAQQIVIKWKKDMQCGGLIRRANLSIEELVAIMSVNLGLDQHSMRQVLDNHIEKITILNMPHYYFDYSRVLICEKIMNPPIDIQTALSSCGFFDPIQSSLFSLPMDLYSYVSKEERESKEPMVVIPASGDFSINHKGYVFFGLEPRVLHTEVASSPFTQMQLEYYDEVYRQDKYEKDMAESAEKMRKMYPSN